MFQLLSQNGESRDKRLVMIQIENYANVSIIHTIEIKEVEINIKEVGIGIDWQKTDKVRQIFQL